LQELAALEHKLFRSLALDSVDEKQACLADRLPLLPEEGRADLGGDILCGLAFCPQQQDRFHVLGNARPGDDERVGDRKRRIRKDASLQYLRRADTELRTRGPEVRIVEDNQPVERRERDALRAAPSSSEALAARLDSLSSGRRS
jgi:hypothetical protein